mgnify:CR=1 FL=1
MSQRRPFLGGNWKMNTSLQEATDLARGVADGLVGSISSVDVALYPPFPYLLAVGAILRERHGAIRLGAQDIWHEPNGAFTGEVSASMLADCSASSALIGHSERRHVVGEDDQLINKKLKATLAGGLEGILCIGETLEQREAGETDAVNERQLRAGLAGVNEDMVAGVVIAYEPVWAIGTGMTATPGDAQNAHAHIRAVLGELYPPAVGERTRIIYGGSVKPTNFKDLLAQPDIDGGLIGGASLKVADFVTLGRTADEYAWSAH